MLFWVWILIIVCMQVLPIFPRLVDLPLEKFQMALAHILQVNVKDLCMIFTNDTKSFFFSFIFYFSNKDKISSILHNCFITCKKYKIVLFIEMGPITYLKSFILSGPMLFFFHSDREEGSENQTSVIFLLEGKQLIPHSYVIL